MIFSKVLKNRIAIFYLFILLLTSCVSSHIPNYHFNQKTAAPQLREDVVLLKKILEANHPSLYWFTPKDSMDYYFNNAINSINDSLSETEFRNKVASVISKIRCGHTAVRFSKDYTKLLEKNRYPIFPLGIKTWEDTMVVSGSYSPKGSILKRGTIITSINGRINKQLLDSMFNIISTDGYSNTYKSQVISGNFPSWYKLAWGLDSTYQITYLDSLGELQSATISNYSPDTVKLKKPITDSIKPKPAPKPVVAKTKKLTRKERRQLRLSNLRSLSIDSSDNTAYMRVLNFTEGHLRKFFRKSFKKLEETKTKNLIIDLRENTGGYMSSSNLLTKYIIDKPFKNADTLAAITHSIKHAYYVRDAFKYWFLSHLVSRKKADGRYHDIRAEKHYYQPKRNHHFTGKVYVLQSGYTYSAATMFTSAIKGQGNVIIIGEESGGGYYGNTATYLSIIILPNSKLRIIMPTYRMVMDAKRTKDGKGVQPDVPIRASVESIKKGIDIKLEKAKEEILRYK